MTSATPATRGRAAPMSCSALRCSRSRMARSSRASLRRRRLRSPPGAWVSRCSWCYRFALTAQRPAQARRGAMCCAVGAGAPCSPPISRLGSLRSSTRRSRAACSSSALRRSGSRVLQIHRGRGAPSRSTLAALALAGRRGRHREQWLVTAARVRSWATCLRVAGGIAWRGYFLLSRESQKELPFRTYLGIAYGIARASCCGPRCC